METITPQPQLPFLTAYHAPESVSDEIIKSFGDEEDEAVKLAIHWSWQNRRVRRMSQRRASEIMGIANSHFSNILNGDKYLPPQKINAFQWACGNRAVSQTIDRFDAMRKQRMIDETAQMVAQYLGLQQAA